MKISVVIPARNDIDNLRICIDRLQSSEEKPDEIIVVDDASDFDLKSSLANDYVTFIRLKTQRGPAAARNAGAKVGRGDILLFIDADVFVNNDTLKRIMAEFKQKRETAVVGVFDNYRKYKTFFGDYKNLWMKFSYESTPRRSALFYTSLAAIKKDIFMSTGGFNENYMRPSTEDTAYGNVLWDAGIRPLINPEITAIHNKEYSFYSILRTDFLRASDLLKMKLRKNIGTINNGNRTSVPLYFIISVFTSFIAFLFILSGKLIPFLLILIFSILLNGKLLAWLHNKRGVFFTLKSALFLPVDHLAVIAGMAYGLFSYLLGNRY